MYAEFAVVSDIKTNESLHHLRNSETSGQIAGGLENREKKTALLWRCVACSVPGLGVELLSHIEATSLILVFIAHY